MAETDFDRCHFGQNDIGQNQFRPYLRKNKKNQKFVTTNFLYPKKEQHIKKLDHLNHFWLSCYVFRDFDITGFKVQLYGFLPYFRQLLPRKNL